VKGWNLPYQERDKGVKDGLGVLTSRGRLMIHRRKVETKLALKRGCYMPVWDVGSTFFFTCCVRTYIRLNFKATNVQIYTLKKTIYNVLMCVSPSVSIQVHQYNNRSINNTLLWWSTKAACFGCVKQPSYGFVFQNKYRKIYSYSHTIRHYITRKYEAW